MSTEIAWTDETWNPTRGCTIVSDGCQNCYAMRQARRFSGPGKAYEGLTKMTSRGPVWTGKVRLVPEKLHEPLRWRKPRRVFVDSMSDLFHEDVPDEFIDRVFAVMALADRHVFQVLTKRPERMAAYFADEFRWAFIEGEAQNIHHERTGDDPSMWLAVHDLHNCWLGTSCENQATFDERVRHLVQVPAAVRFLSLEPLLGPIDCQMALETFRGTDPMLKRDPSPVGWVIVGGESGYGARPCSTDWIYSIVDQCRVAGVPCFVKQMGGVRDKRADPAQWPEDLRVREFPKRWETTLDET